MAKGASIRALNLQTHCRLSQERAVWLDGSDAPSSNSIPANIAEGFKERGRADKVRILNIAQGSLEESRYYLILSRDLDYADVTSLHPELEEVSKLLQGYIRAIEQGKS